VKITPRDQQVLDLIRQGCSNKEIGDALSISARTVKMHIRSMCQRCGLDESDGQKRVRLINKVSGAVVVSIPDSMRLTPHQAIIARLVCHGLSNKEIAAKVGLSEGTVKNHLRPVFDKAGVWSRLELHARLTSEQPTA
jgi:DNA-binding NarL/FixJ family response regulator